MSESQKSNGDETNFVPADQPKKPQEADNCEKTTPEWPDPPKWCEPPECKLECDCPPGVGSDSVCEEIQKMIAEQTIAIATAEKAKAYKTELEGLLAKAKTASQEYTKTKYDDLIKRWLEQDEQIAALLHKLVCSVDCWECVIECTICARINNLILAEQRLYSEGPPPPNGTKPPTLKFYNLYDLQYWHKRDRDKKDRAFKRIKKVLEAWEKPAQTIDKVLTDNAKLIADASKVIGTEPGSAFYDVFFKLVPMHLAIAPPNDKAVTKIDKKYVDFCCCKHDKPDDSGQAKTEDCEQAKTEDCVQVEIKDCDKSDDCCGPDVGEWSMRERLISVPLPYLIDPAAYYKLICCLIKARYAKAKETLDKADAKLVEIEDMIKRNQTLLDDNFKQGAFEKEVKAAIPGKIDCKQYPPKGKGKEQDKDKDSGCSSSS